MNKVIDSMLAHRSIRSYTDRTVSDEAVSYTHLTLPTKRIV